MMNNICGRRGVDQEVFDREAAICRAFANPTQLRILDMLANHECSVSELQKQLRVSKANLSQHLAVLRASGLVRASMFIAPSRCPKPRKPYDPSKGAAGSNTPDSWLDVSIRAQSCARTEGESQYVACA